MITGNNGGPALRLSHPTIYEPQLARAHARTCGAAALCMVYRSLGLECRQEEIWTRLTASRLAARGARACSLAADALRQGLAAVLVQAQSPWQFLLACSQAGVGVILNHRLSEPSPWGHYTVLEAIDEQAAWVHDPQFGPHRRLEREELLRLWQGCPGRTEIAGRVAIVVGRIGEPTSCVVCQRVLPYAIECPNCKHINALQPAAAIGCGIPGCVGRRWHRIYCPHCDWAESTIGIGAPDIDQLDPISIA